MNISQKSILLLFLFFFSFISCKKNQEIYQERTYIGSYHHQAEYTIYDYIPTVFDSITLEPIEFEETYSSLSVDTLYTDTVLVKVFLDSILFGEYDKFKVNELNVYRWHLPGYTSKQYTLWGDSLHVYYTYVYFRDRGLIRENFYGVKQ